MSQVQVPFDGESLITPEMIAIEGAAPRALGHDEQVATAELQLALTLQIARQRFEAGDDAGRVTGLLFAAMHKMRADLDPAVWQKLVPLAQDHPVADFVHQDPFTQWSFEKPRGYSGDAQLLDFIYGHPSADADIASATPLGRAIYDYTRDAPAAAAVRERRDLLAQHVDEIAATRGDDTEILTIAAGHLREANLSVALREKRIKRWVALDQDPLSVGSIMRDFAGTRVEAINGSVRGLLDKAYNLGQFDFVYAAGLYDYLPHNASVKLTRLCVDALKPNGVYLFANFHRDIVDDGYMETFMNWALLLRSEDEMWDIINASVDRNTVEASVVFGANRNIVYGILKKHS